MISECVAGGQAGKMAAAATVTKPLLQMLAQYAEEFLGAPYDTLMGNIRKVCYHLDLLIRASRNRMNTCFYLKQSSCARLS